MFIQNNVKAHFYSCNTTAWTLSPTITDVNVSFEAVYDMSMTADDNVIAKFWKSFQFYGTNCIGPLIIVYLLISLMAELSFVLFRLGGY